MNEQVHVRNKDPDTEQDFQVWKKESEIRLPKEFIVREVEDELTREL